MAEDCNAVVEGDFKVPHGDTSLGRIRGIPAKERERFYRLRAGGGDVQSREIVLVQPGDELPAGAKELAAKQGFSMQPGEILHTDEAVFVGWKSKDHQALRRAGALLSARLPSGNYRLAKPDPEFFWDGA